MTMIRKELELIKKKLRRVELPPHQLEALGLAPDWNQHISEPLLRRALTVKRQYAGVFKELAR
jgi:hypothetical protein